MVRGPRKTRKVSSESENEGSDIDETAASEDAQDVGSENDVKPKASEPTTKMFLVSNDLDKLGWENVAPVSLPNPRTGNPAIYFIDTMDLANDSSRRGHFLFEVLTLDQPTRSWFIGEDVVSDGNWRMVTHMDPLFLILPIISKSNKAKPLSDHLCDSLPHHVIDIICKRLGADQLCQVATKKECDDIIAYAYSEETTLSWLVKKVNKTVAFLKEKDITRMEASVSSNFIQSTNSVTKKDEQEYTRYACDIVGDYLENSLKKKLLTKVGLPAEADRKRKTDGVGGDEERDGRKKKLKATATAEDGTTVQPLEDYSSATSNANSSPNVPKGAKAKSLHKAAQGSHSLLKFFSAK